MKTKDEILRETGRKSSYVTYDDIVEGTKDEVFAAMDTYAKEVAIAFAEWISGVYSKEYNGWKHYRSGDIFTQEELFDLFLTEQSTVK